MKPQDAAPKSGTDQKRRNWLLWVGLPVVCIIFGFSGWLLRGAVETAQSPVPLRLSGYKFINPLLACNVSTVKLYPELTSLSQGIQNIIDTYTKSGYISKASAYFVDLANGKWSTVYGDQKYFPSSLGKIPIMIAYYQIAENDRSILDKRILYPTGGTDLNLEQDITPEKTIVPGHEYTVEELIEYMVKYSDNNAAILLYNNIDEGQLKNVYSNLQIPLEADKIDIANLDYMTPQQIAILFRILYNSTYLTREYSEKALALMSQTSFTEGIVSGVASSTVVSHKLGLVGIGPGIGTSTEHELHDCGIVYGKDPYIMCVMTRGTAPLTKLESVISNIASAADTAVNKEQ